MINKYQRHAPRIVMRKNSVQIFPNILWVSAKDISPHLGAYGDEYALESNTSPNIDRFAKQSLTLLNASSNAPVCAVARTSLISGMHAPAES